MVVDLGMRVRLRFQSWLLAIRLTREAVRILRGFGDDREQSGRRFLLLAWRVFPWREFVRRRRPVSRTHREAREKEWNLAYREAAAATAGSNREQPFVFSKWALRLQASQVRHAFRDKLKLPLTRSALASLRHYRDVGCAMRDFLEFCGLPQRLDTVMSPEMQVSMFCHDADVRRHTASDLQQAGGHVAQRHDEQRQRILAENRALRRQALGDSGSRGAGATMSVRVDTTIAVQDRALAVFHALMIRKGKQARERGNAWEAYDGLLSLGWGEAIERTAQGG